MPVIATQPRPSRSGSAKSFFQAAIALHLPSKDQCDANLRRPQENERSPRLSSHNVVAVDPNSLTVAPYPMSRPPDVIAPAHIITRAASVIGPITNLDRDSAWVRAIARATSVTGSITIPIIRSVTRARAAVILVFASA